MTWPFVLPFFLGTLPAPYDCSPAGRWQTQGPVTSDGVQDLLPPNMAPWHTEDFRVREFEKMADAGRSR